MTNAPAITNEKIVFWLRLVDLSKLDRWWRDDEGAKIFRVEIGEAVPALIARVRDVEQEYQAYRVSVDDKASDDVFDDLYVSPMRDWKHRTEAAEARVRELEAENELLKEQLESHNLKPTGCTVMGTTNNTWMK